MSIYSFLRMSWYDLAFDSYKKARHLIFPSNLSNLLCPTQKALVSIVLPVYNGGEMLRESIDSILAQTYSKFELITIDDGSTDQSGEILEEYAAQDHRIRVIHQNNRKLPASLSLGFSLAKGEFRTWTSHDNRMKPFFLEMMVDCLHRHPDWDMVYANVDLIDEQGKFLVNSGWYLEYQRPPGSCHIHLPPNTGCLNTLPNNYIGAAFLYRDRVSYLLGPYAVGRYTVEDYDYCMQVNSLLSLHHADFETPVYDYRFHSKSLTANAAELKINSHRDKLFAFDSFRRDFYLSPMGWIFEAAESGISSTDLRSKLEERIKIGKQILLSRGEYPADLLPDYWMPCVYCYLTSQPDAAPLPPVDLPPNTMKVLFSIAGDCLPALISTEWDLAINWGNMAELPRLSGSYQGWLQAHDLETVMTSVDIFARIFHVHNLEGEINNPSSVDRKIAIIISTLDRNEDLQNALISLAKQSMDPSDYEVIVVNNAPDDHLTNTLVAQLREEYFQNDSNRLKLVLCPIPGLSTARNCGIAASKSRLVGFFDDDAVATSDWLDVIWDAYQKNPNLGVIGGTIVLRPPQPRPNVLKPGWEPLWGQFIPEYNNFRIVKHWFEFPWGSNWFAPRKLMLEIGGFRSQYGRKKKDFGGGEEVIAASMIQKLGFDIGVEPKAVIFHNPGFDRYSYEHVWKSNLQGTLVAYRIQKSLYVPFYDTIPVNIKQMVKILLKTFTFLLPGSWHPWEGFFHFLKFIARFILFWEQLGDAFSRFRKPIVMKQQNNAAIRE